MKRTKVLHKKMLTLSLCMMVVLLTGVVTQAATTRFTLTVNSSEYQQDNMSKRTQKAGGQSYENKCYVTATGFQGTGTVYVQSIKLNDSKVHSKSEIALGSVSALNQTKSQAYNTYAKSGEYYYLKGRFGASATGNSLNVVGRYTP